MDKGLSMNLGVILAVTVAFVAVGGSGVAMVALAAAVTVFLWVGRRIEILPKAGLLAIVALVPLGYLGTMVSFGMLNSFTKLVFIPAFAVLFGEWALCRRPLVLGGRQGLWVMGFGATFLLSYLASAHTVHSALFLSRLVGMLLLFVLTANVMRSDHDLALLLAVMAVACGLSAAGSVFMPVMAAPNPVMNNGAVVRMTGWSANDAPTFGSDLLISLLTCLYFAIVTRRRWLRVVLAAAVVGFLIGIVYTYARGVSLVMVLSAGYLLFRLRRRLSWTGVAVAGAAVLCLAPFLPEAYWDRMGTALTQFSSDATIGRRLDTWRIGWKLFEQSPLLGFGPGNFIVQYMSPEFRFDRAGVPSVCFNLFLSVATQAGLMGLVALGGVLLLAFRNLRRLSDSFGTEESLLKHIAELLNIALVTLLMMSLFEPTDFQKTLWIVLGAIVAAAHIRRQQTDGVHVP